MNMFMEHAGTFEWTQGKPWSQYWTFPAFMPEKHVRIFGLHWGSCQVRQLFFSADWNDPTFLPMGKNHHHPSSMLLQYWQRNHRSSTSILVIISSPIFGVYKWWKLARILGHQTSRDPEKWIISSPRAPKKDTIEVSEKQTTVAPNHDSAWSCFSWKKAPC